MQHSYKSMIINTLDNNSVKPFIEKIHLAKPDSHKGQNGKLLIIGGSSLFHSAIIWVAEVASHFVDMVHVASTPSNNIIIQELKTKWQGGIVIPTEHIEEYIKEDDVVLIGNGMMRTGKEGAQAKKLTQHFLSQYADKKWVIDAGALQVMDPQWLLTLQTKPILTPHQKEFQTLFGENISNLSQQEKIALVQKKANEYHCILLVKSGYDIVSDGQQSIIIEGGNAGLTKGGTGDILAALIASFYTKNDPFTSCVIASLLLKQSAQEMYKIKGYWFNNEDLISALPDLLYRLLKQSTRLS